MEAASPAAAARGMRRAHQDAPAPYVGVPAARHRLVQRTAVVQRLASSTDPVISVVAPPGYGKTTVLTQWAELLGPTVAWLSCGRTHNDPVAVWDDILTALEQVGPVPGEARALLPAIGGGIGVVPRLVVSLRRLEGPVVVVLDHLELISDPQSLASVAELAMRLPAGWRLALASRDALPLPLGRMRVERHVLEVDSRDLAMTVGEAIALLRDAGVEVPPEQAAELVARTEGWPAGLYLAALAIGSGFPTPGFAFSGDDRFVEDYLRSELLAHLSPTDLRFLVRTSILDRMCGPLCDALVGGTSSALTLRRLEEHNLLVVPLDHRGEWYRYHHLLRELLEAELRRTAPEVVGSLHERAATWYDAHGMAEEAIDHAAAAVDSARVARAVLDVMHRPDLGTRPDELHGVRRRVDQSTDAAPAGLSALTTAELRLLPLLPTHLSFPQIAEQLYVSRHTVKSQVTSIYRKLGVSSRSGAVALLSELADR